MTIRSRKKLAKHLIKRAERGKSRFTPQEMRQKITEIRKRAHELSIEQQLMNLFARLSNDRVQISSLTASFLIHTAKTQPSAIAALNMREVLAGKDIANGDALHVDSTSQTARGLVSAQESEEITMLSDYKKKKAPRP